MTVNYCEWSQRPKVVGVHQNWLIYSTQAVCACPGAMKSHRNPAFALKQLLATSVEETDTYPLTLWYKVLRSTEGVYRSWGTHTGRDKSWWKRRCWGEDEHRNVKTHGAFWRGRKSQGHIQCGWPSAWDAVLSPGCPRESSGGKNTEAKRPMCWNGWWLRGCIPA